MKLKNKLAFPIDRVGYAAGMTYREWLIGQIAAGPASTVLNAYNIIAVADEIIKQLEDEISE